MESALVATKLHVPSPRSGLIGRARLIDRLKRGLASRLVLVSAPAGFGKTSLLTQWLAAVAGHGHTVAWLALDKSDNRAPIFWPHLVAAVETAVPGFGAGLVPLLEASGSTTEGVLAALVNELDALSGELYLVLDDYHLIDDQGIQEGVTFLLEHLPAHAHLRHHHPRRPAAAAGALSGTGRSGGGPRRRFALHPRGGLDVSQRRHGSRPTA